MKNKKKRLSKSVSVKTNDKSFIESLARGVVTHVISRFVFEEVKPYLETLIDIIKDTF